MRAFLACIKKDILLFISRKSAVAVLVLPVILLLVLLPGFGETAAARTFVKPFSIVIHDMDNSVMSRSLTNQLKDIEIFSEITAVREDTVDTGKYFEAGYAAVMTIPENFFYAMYDMNNSPATVELNPEMPAESAMLEAILSSVSDIVTAEQHAWKAEYLVLQDNGEDSGLASLYYDSANHELRRALSRGSAFSDTQVIADYAESSVRSAWATVISLMCMLIPLCVLKGLPEELSVGIIDRLRCSDSGEGMLIASKYFAALILFGVPALFITLIIRPGITVIAGFGLFLAFSSAFAFFAMLSFSSTSPSRTQLEGNIILVISMLAGGALYPYMLLPSPVQTAAYLTIPFHLLRTLNSDAVSLVWLSCFMLVFSAAAFFFIRRQRLLGRRG